MLSSVSVLSRAPSSSEDFFFDSWSKFFLTMKPVASRRRLARTDADDGDDATFQKVTTDASSSSIARERRRKTTDRSDAYISSVSPRLLSLARENARVIHDRSAAEGCDGKRRISSRHRFRVHARARASPRVSHLMSSRKKISLFE